MRGRRSAIVAFLLFRSRLVRFGSRELFVLGMLAFRTASWGLPNGGARAALRQRGARG
jgi:hypothetical protein